MIVAFKGNHSGIILLEALEGERRSGEANGRAWLVPGTEPKARGNGFSLLDSPVATIPRVLW